jgi:hydroxymethylglutaryl-CoA lyase
MCLPSSVRITDVALRDGLQNHPVLVPAPTKVSLLNGLLASGVRSVEVGSFVHPRLVPAMADTEQVCQALPDRPDVRLAVLVPNLRGAQRAIAAGARSVVVVLSASESHSQGNTNRSVAESLRAVGEVREALAAAGVRDITAAVATAFCCPFDGVTPLGTLRRLIAKLTDIGFDTISLADTIGRANPMQVERTVATMRDAFPVTTFGLHLHDTYGMGMANVAAGLRQGVRHFDSALGGIGGCPFAPGAAGNIATEDLVFMLSEMGLETGVDLESLRDVASDLGKYLGVQLDSAISRALSWDVGGLLSRPDRRRM